MDLGRTYLGKDCIPMKLKIYGCRGSAPYSHQNRRVGGNTSCIRLFSGDYSIFLDAGSGLIGAGHEINASGESLPGPQDILLSHLHMDHIDGLRSFAPSFDEKKGVRIFTISRDERSLVGQVFGVFQPPYWPVSLEEAAHAEFVQIYEDVPFAAGPLAITPFTASHPDKTTSFHIANDEKSIVYLLDSEMSTLDSAEYEKLVKHCKDADMVVFDAAYSPKDYPSFRGWGHSTVEDGVKLHRDSGCKRVLFSHFAQHYSDDEILDWKRYFDRDCYILASEGMEITL